MIRFFVLVCALSLLAVPVVAQPIGRPEPVAQGEGPARQVEATVREFVANLNGANIYFSAVDKVANARDYGYFGGPKWGESWESKRGTARLELDKVEVSGLTATTATARVSYRWKSYQPRFRSETLVETLKMQIGAPPNFGEKTRWQIVAPPLAKAPDEVTIMIGAPQANVPDNDLALNEVAASIANPQSAWTQENAQKSLLNLKQLALAALQFAQDYDEKFALAPAFFQEALLPYSQKPEIFRIPATGEPYTFNGNLSGGSSADANSPNKNRVVMFYEGQNEQPVFRYSGRAAVLFADGHAALISPEETKSLIWKP